MNPHETSIGHFLSLVTLFFNNSVINNLDNYKPLYHPASYYFFHNLSDENAVPRPVQQDLEYFSNSTFFPRCCQPGTAYDIDNRGCVPSANTVPIHEELNITVNLIQSGLKYCTVVVDRFVKKYDLKVQEGNASLKVEDEIFGKRKFCVDNIWHNNEDYVVRLCKEDNYCEKVDRNIANEWCVHKCCEEGYQLRNYICVLNDRMGIHVKNNTQVYERTDNYAMIYGTHINCKTTMWRDFQEIEFVIKANGSMFMENAEYHLNDYCLATNYDTSTGRIADIIVICEFREVIYLKWLLIKAAVLITCLCFVITLAVYIFVYKLEKLIQRIITGFCLIDLAFWCLYAIRIFSFRFGNFCVSFAYIYYFMMISRLSWLNVLSYEISRTIGSPRIITPKPSRQSLRKNMVNCTLYAVSVPMVCTLLLIFGNQGIYDEGRFKPLIDQAVCYLDTRGLDDNMGYFHLFLPVLILIVVNIVLFIKTVLYFWNTKRDLEKMRDSNVGRSKNNQSTNKKVFIILKLGLVMGVTWIYYIYCYISSFENNDDLRNIGVTMSLINILEGVYFFIIFAVKWKAVKDTLGKASIFLSKTSLTSSTETVTSSVSSQNTNRIPISNVSKKI
ncbi:hypothetical protein Trydic_g11594 [Trypoxylus dichotomus]